MKTLIVTGNQPRHFAFANRINHVLHGEKMFVLEEKNKPKNDFLISKEPFYFAHENHPENCLFCKTGEVNNESIVKEMGGFSPDFMFVFGCSLLKPEAFSVARFGCINIHTGIVQHFRGVDSCFWAIHDGIPQGIGATIHYVDKTIDAGNIIYQQRPHLEDNDDFSDLFMKSCACGFFALEYCVPYILSHLIRPKALLNKGKLYNTRDFSSEKLDVAQQKLSEVLINYRENKEKIDDKIFDYL